MGNTRVEDYTRKLTILVLLTNLLTIYILLGPTKLSSYTHYHHNLPLWDRDRDPSSTTTNAATTTTALHHALNDTRALLVTSHSEAAELRRKLTSTNLLVQALLIELTRVNDSTKPTTITRLHDTPAHFISDIINGLGLAPEARLAVGPHKVHGSGSGSNEVYPSFGAGCLTHKEDLIKYLSYEVGGDCPLDDMLAQKLILKGCDPLPRRRCRPTNAYVGPESQWATPPIANFNRWVVDHGLDYSIDRVLATRPPNTVRIGLDIGGGFGTFATRMRDKNITIITTTATTTTTTNHHAEGDGPLSRLVAARGLVPLLHVSISQRLPFSDSTLDIVHSMHVLTHRVPTAMLEFTLYDIYRVIRPGGLFWLDHFFWKGSQHQLNDTYVSMLERVGFRKIRLDVGRRLDRGAHEDDEWCLSALLEKPIS